MAAGPEHLRQLHALHQPAGLAEAVGINRPAGDHAAGRLGVAGEFGDDGVVERFQLAQLGQDDRAAFPGADLELLDPGEHLLELGEGGGGRRLGRGPPVPRQGEQGLGAVGNGKGHGIDGIDGIETLRIEALGIGAAGFAAKDQRFPAVIRWRLAVLTAMAGGSTYESEAKTRVVPVHGPATGPGALLTGRPSF
jgi:hypothetical protein